MNRDDSSSMSSFEHVELTETEANPSLYTKPPHQHAAAVAVTAAASPVAEDAAAPATTPPAPPSCTSNAAAPVLKSPTAEAPSTSPTAQAAGALQSMLGFLAGGAAAADAQQGGRAGEGGSVGAHVDDEPGSPLADPVAEFEKEALEAAHKAEEAVKEVGQKLLHGAAEAREGLSSLAHGFTSWWSTLDPGTHDGGASSGTAGSGAAGVAAASQRAAQDVQQAAVEEALGLEAGETVLESFSCQLLQTYISSANFFTPARQVPFPGRLHITSQRLCFVFEEKGVAPIKLVGKAMKAVTKQAACGQQGLPERLEVQLEQAGQALVLSHFALGEVEMDSALALVEHLAEGAEGEA